MIERQIPWQEFVDAIDWIIGDHAQHMPEVGFRIYPVELDRPKQTIHRRCPTAASIGSKEQIVLS